MRRLSDRVRRGLLVVFAGVVGLAGAGLARASDAYPLYVVPSAVEQPAGTPPRVVVHGAFFRLKSATEFLYADPQCGVMYFQCAAGDETLCRLQWDNLAAHIPTAATPTKACAGFGTLYSLSTATLRQEGAPLGTPDPWDLGMGIGDGAYVDNKCPAAQKLVCPRGAGGASGTGGASASGGAPGTGGASASGGAPGTGGAPGSGGAPGTGGASGSGGAPGTGGAPVASTGGATVVDAAGDTGHAGNSGPAPRGNGCAVGGRVAWAHAAWGVLFAFIAAGVRRRNRPR